MLLANCKLLSNIGTYVGGAVNLYSQRASVTLVMRNCIAAQNFSSMGSALFAQGNTTSELINCQIPCR